MSPDLVLRTRQHFAANQMACIAEVESGQVKLPSHVSLNAYREWCLATRAEILAGKWDHTFTFRQRAEWLETGRMRALLP